MQFAIICTDNAILGLNTRFTVKVEMVTTPMKVTHYHGSLSRKGTNLLMFVIKIDEGILNHGTVYTVIVSITVVGTTKGITQLNTIVKEIVILAIDGLNTLSHLTISTEVVPVAVTVLNKFILDDLIITKEVNILSTTLEDLSACDGTSITKWCWQELAVG